MLTYRKCLAASDIANSQEMLKISGQNISDEEPVVFRTVYLLKLLATFFLVIYPT